jgi:acid phosphatase class B
VDYKTTKYNHRGRTHGERTELVIIIAKDVARKLIEMHIERRDLLPEVLPSGRIQGNSGDQRHNPSG